MASRACVIVLDAVGAGALPDAADFGDEGSDTLGNVARAVGGLDLSTLEALGLGNIEPLAGCAPQPGAPAVAGPPRLTDRLFEARLLARNGWGQEKRKALRFAFYLRGHWLRMPPLMLARHLWTKATR